jgi:V/A-type H+-transporting ATPase subunit E
MSGLNRLVEQIKTAAKEAADAKLAQARQEAENIIGEAEERAKQESSIILREAEEKASDIIERAKSSADLQKRRAILAAKQQIIEDVIKKTNAALKSLSNEEYSDLILKMVSKYAHPQKGQIIFSKQDLERLPAGFEQKLNKAVESKGGSLLISSENRPIEGGFILVYGDIEENCTFTAIYSSKHDILQDKIHEFIFT